MNDPGNHPDELLPWLANGTLGGEELARAQAHVESCARCREELAFLGALRATVKQLDAGEGAGDLARERLLRSVRGEAAGRHPWWRPALAAAAALVIAIEGAVIVNLWRTEPAGIVPLGETRVDVATVQVRFQPQAAESAIRALLQREHAAIVDGPGALGVYRLRFESATAASEAAARLRNEPEIIAHAEVE